MSSAPVLVGVSSSCSVVSEGEEERLFKSPTDLRTLGLEIYRYDRPQDAVGDSAATGAA